MEILSTSVFHVTCFPQLFQHGVVPPLFTITSYVECYRAVLDYLDTRYVSGDRSPYPCHKPIFQFLKTNLILKFSSTYNVQ